MNAAQRKTLARIFEKPTRADVRWAAIEALIKALGGEVTEGRGSQYGYNSATVSRRSVGLTRSA